MPLLSESMPIHTFFLPTNPTLVSLSTRSLLNDLEDPNPISALSLFIWNILPFNCNGTKGFAVPMPTLPFRPSIERIGAVGPVVVPMAKAFILCGIVVVAARWYEMVRFAAVEEE